MSSSSWEWAGAHPFFVLFLSIGVGLVIASPYIAHLIFVRRKHGEEQRDFQTFAALAPHRLDPEYAGERPNYFFSGLAFLSLMLIANFGFKAAAGTPWFYLLNLYYGLVVAFYLWRALSRPQFEQYRLASPNANRITWMLRWLPLLVILPTAGWFVNSYPLWKK